MDASCIYCRRTYATKPGEGITHGICSTCHVIVSDDLDAGGQCEPDHIRAVADLRLPACQRAAGL